MTPIPAYRPSTFTGRMVLVRNEKNPTAVVRLVSRQGIQMLFRVCRMASS